MTLTRRSFLSRLAILAAAPVAVARAIAAPPKPRVSKGWGEGSSTAGLVFPQEYQCAFWNDVVLDDRRFLITYGRQSGKTQMRQAFLKHRHLSS